MTTRIKVVNSAIKSREELERIVRETARFQLTREARIAERDKAIQVIADGHNKLIDGYGQKIEANMSLLEQWAGLHPEEFPKDARSIVIDGNRLGYRLGQPQPKPMKKLTWKAVLERIFELSETVQEMFIRTKFEPNKEAMLAAREVQPELLAQIGVEIIQLETFYLDPAREGQPDKRLVTGAKEVA